MTGPLERMQQAHFGVQEYQEAAWSATVAVAGVDVIAPS
jgi:hypothetical protein